MVYLLAGSEQYLKEEQLSKIKSAFLDQESQDFNFNVFYAGTTPFEQAWECAHTVPFLGRKRVILVRQCEEFSASDKELVLSYVRAPATGTCLILETSEINLSQNFFSEIYKYVRVILCKPLKDNQVLGWIKAQVEAKAKLIKEPARKLLIDNLGNDLKLLSSALEKLILYIGEKQTIEVSDVEKLVGPDIATSAFELFDAVSACDTEKAWQILDSLLKDGINSSQILGALTYEIISARRREKGSFLALRSLKELQKTDSDIKTSRQEPRLALELLLVRLMNSS